MVEPAMPVATPSMKLFGTQVLISLPPDDFLKIVYKDPLVLAKALAVPPKTSLTAICVPDFNPSIKPSFPFYLYPSRGSFAN